MINSFTGKYDFLSNFYPSVVELYEIKFPTVEHAFQACKSRDPDEILRIKNCATPGQAKRMGRQVKLRPEWEKIKIEVMLDLLRKKFKDPTLKQKLLDTEDEELEEGNTWNDTFWGVCDGVGQNHLGKLLMQVRNELKPFQGYGDNTDNYDYTKL